MNFEIFLSSIVLLAALGSCEEGDLCKKEKTGDPITDTKCYQEKCLDKIKSQIKVELNAAFTYMIMGTMFDEPAINHEGLAKFFYRSSSEERGHAIMMLDYLNMRGYNKLTEKYEVDFTEFKTEYTKKSDLKSVEYGTSLEYALDMEIKVTDKIQHILKECETEKDFHAQDKFIYPVMNEQHEGIRKLQGAIRQLKNIKPAKQFDNDKQTDISKSNIALAEYIIDQKILNGEILA